MKRILCIIGGMNAGGAETFMMKILRSINKEEYMIDFAVAIKDKGIYDDEILSYGGKIYHITPKTKGFFKFVNSVYHIVKDNGYNSVLRISQNSVSTIELLIAKIAGAKILGMRSSNSDACGGIGERIGHQIFKPLAMAIPNVKIAPSTCAAQFMFGKKCVQKGTAVILKNGLDTSKYAFDQQVRCEYRKQIGLSEDTLVVGHIGRFNYQKNHRFLIEVFAEVYKINRNSVLLLIGDGELKEEIYQYVDDIGIKENVLFLGVKKDIPGYLMAMDVFCLPSLFEGMPNTVIEAQGSGLPCVISDTITKEAKLTENVKYLPLKNNKNDWANWILKMSRIPRLSTDSTIRECGYDINEVSNEFIKILY